MSGGTTKRRNSANSGEMRNNSMKAAAIKEILVIVGYEDLLNSYNVGGLVSAVLIFALLTSPVSFQREY